MLQEAFKEQALSRARIFEWFSRFKKGDLSIEDQPRSGRPSSSRNDENIAKIREKLNEVRRELELSSAHSDSRPRHETVAAKFVPRLLRRPTELPTHCVPGLGKGSLKMTQTSCPGS